MKKTLTVLAGITAVAVVSMAIYRKRRRNTGYRLSKVAEEGYETAHDVLFPQKLRKEKNLLYGPVLPR